MKTRITLIIVLLICFNVTAQEKTQKEIVIIGTMHTVPKIVKKSYKPMLKIAKKYNPQAIYVESPMANDTASWEYLKNGWSKNYQRFYKLSDSIQKSWELDIEKYNKLTQKNFSNLTTSEIDYMIKASIYNRDNGNYELYSYLKKYGVEGAKKPTRHEDGDLTYKLALEKNLRVHNMDDQQTNKEYHNAWSKCVKEGTANGNNAMSNKMNKKQYSKAKLPAIFRKLGKHTNKRENLEQLHTMSSFSYVVKDTQGCKEGRKYWNERNMRMAKNIANQVLQSTNSRNLVVVGASHVIGLEKELKTKYPELKVILMNDL